MPLHIRKYADSGLIKNKSTKKQFNFLDNGIRFALIVLELRNDTTARIKPCFADSFQLFPAISSYFQLFPALLLLYGGANKLKATVATMDVEYLLWLELFTNLFLPLVEIFLAIWLVFYPNRVAVISSFVLLSCYVGYLIQVAWNGGVSCKCLGSGYSSVMFMMGIDLLALSCLLIHQEFSAIFRRRALLAGFVAIIPMTSLFWISCPGVATAVSRSMNPGSLRTVFLPKSNLPTISNFETDVVIANRTRQLVEIDEFMISCGCTTFHPQQVTLPPGGSETLHVSIDLNKVFVNNLAPHASFEVSAGCYDKERNEIDQVKIFAGTTYRTFTPVSSTVIHHGESSSNREQIAIPIHWISHDGRRHLQVTIGGNEIPSETTDAVVRFAVDHPNTPFKTLDALLSHDTGSAKFNAMVKLQIATTPGRVLATRGNKSSSGDKSQLPFAKAVYRDSAGAEISQARLNVGQSSNGEIELKLDELMLVGNGDVSIQFEREGGFVHHLVIPQSPQRLTQ